jgi:hypothetical protein
VKPRFPFPLQVAAALCLIGGIAAYPLARYATGATVSAAIAGAAIATINVLAGYAAIEFSIGKPVTVFLRAVLGGMGIRMGVMAAALVVLIRFFTFDALALVASLGICYSVFLVLEILYIQQTVSRKQH